MNCRIPISQKVLIKENSPVLVNTLFIMEMQSFYLFSFKLYMAQADLATFECNSTARHEIALEH